MVEEIKKDKTKTVKSVPPAGTERNQSEKVQVKKVLSAPVYDISGKEVDTIELPDSIFAIKAPDSLLAQYVRVFLTNQRKGLASAKTRGEVIGSTRKIYRQKGTGRARHGANKAPIFVGGGVAHGPAGKVFSLKMNKKQKRMALFAALTNQLTSKKIRFVKGLLDMPAKTKEMSVVMGALDNPKKGTVLVTFPKDKSRNLVLASRNLNDVGLKDVESLNAYIVLAAQRIVFATEALPVLLKQYGY